MNCRVCSRRFHEGCRQGTGLGLSIARGIGTEHGGQITVSSALGQETNFRVSLPSAGSKKEARAMNEQITDAHLLIIAGQQKMGKLIETDPRLRGMNTKVCTS